jgi:ABC-type Fe3+ transport system substrate-binding protein
MMKTIDMKDAAAAAAAGKKTLDWLVSKAAQRSRFLRKWQLQPKSPEMLAALGVLAAYWSQDPDVQEIVNLAIKSNDPELKKALGAQRVTGRFKAITD